MLKEYFNAYILLFDMMCDSLINTIDRFSQLVLTLILNS